MISERLMTTAGAAALWCGLIGCGKTEEPVVVYEPEIGLADIARTTLDVKANAYSLLDADQTMGRFPGAIAVARLKLSDAKHPSDGSGVALKPLQPSEAAYWKLMNGGYLPKDLYDYSALLATLMMIFLLFKIGRKRGLNYLETVLCLSLFL